MLFLTVREPPRDADLGDEVVSEAWHADLIAGVRRVGSAPGFVPLALAFGISAMMGAVLGAWGPAFLQRSHGVPLEQVGVVIGPAVGIGGLAGTMASGALADWRVRRRDSLAVMLGIPLVALPLSAPFMAGFVFAPSLTLTMICAAAMNFLLSCAFVPCINFAVTRADPRDRGLVSTLMLISSGLIGGTLGPFIVGALSDVMTPQLGPEGLRYALSAMILSPIAATVFMMAAIRRVPATPIGQAQTA